MSFFLLGVGLILLFVGGELLVRGSVGLALAFGVSKLVVAVVLVGFGTSAPEVLVSIESAVLGYPQLALGNAVGSNIANILLIVGVTAVIHPIVVERAQVRRDTWTILVITAAFVAAGVIGDYKLWHGLVMIAALIVYVADSYRRARRGVNIDLVDADDTATDEPEDIEGADLKVWHAFAFAIIGLILVIVGADLLIEGAVGIAHKLGVSDVVIGLTIVAIGSSLPELAICVSAARRREPLVAVGNVLGSNAFNLLGAMGIVAVVTDVGTHNLLIMIDLGIMLAITVALTILLLRIGRIGRMTGGIFLCAYLAYLAGQFSHM